MYVDVGTCPHQVLQATLTLTQARGPDYAHPILVSTPNFESHRRPCLPMVYKKKTEYWRLFKIYKVLRRYLVLFVKSIHELKLLQNVIDSML